MYLPLVVYAIILVAIFLSWIAGLTLAESGALLGIALATAKIVLDWHKEYKEQLAKAEEKQERVQTKLEYMPVDNPTINLLRLKVTLLNPSHSVPVRIRSVVLNYKIGDKSDFTNLYTNLKSPPAGSALPFPIGDSSIDIEPRKSAAFPLLYRYVTQAHIDAFTLLSSDEHISIVISSHVGEIDRITGDKILAIMKD